jgi:hypothetical protein
MRETEQMNVQTIRKRLSKEGPFVVRTSDGQEYSVPHPEFVWVGRYNLVIEDEEGGIDVIDPIHVVAIHRAGSGQGKNGVQHSK